MSSDKFILELSLLRPADIILTGNKTLTSLLVRGATASRYSHAALYIGGTTIEATLDGVFSKSPQRLLFDRPTDVLVLRSKRPLSQDEAQAICDYAQSKVGSLYSIPEAITVKARSLLNHKDSDRQFCSRLVAKSFEHANFDLMNLRSPAFCTPRQLSLCKAFEAVEGVVRPASAQEVAFAMTEDPARENLRQTYEWLGKVRKLVEQTPELAKKWDIQAQNDVNDFLVAHPEYDDQISEFLKSSGYLEFYTTDSRKNPHRYKADLFLARLKRTREPDELINSELSKEPDLLRRYGIMQHNFVNFYKETELTFFRLHVQLYNSMLNEILTRITVVKSTLRTLRLNEQANSLNPMINAVKALVREGRGVLQAVPPT